MRDGAFEESSSLADGGGLAEVWQLRGRVCVVLPEV
jgi:hypothetical protein